ncbi:40S ribosomal protein S5-1 [Hordeum vulgare]|nr:40S ribosomal protein S5-1 [Hordeum vulgare]
MSEGMLHIRDVEGPKKTRSMETRLEAMEQQIFKCQGMVECGLNANHMMIMEFTNKHKMDAIDIGKHLSRIYDRVDQLEGQIYDLQNQNLSSEAWPLRLVGSSSTEPAKALAAALQQPEQLPASLPRRPTPPLAPAAVACPSLTLCSAKTVATHRAA